MARRKTRSAGPQSLLTQAQYLWNQRRVMVWIPFLEERIQELERLIREKGASTQAGEQV